MKANLSSLVLVPAPTGGLNLRDGLASMPLSDCYLLDNFVIKGGKLALRSGYAQHSAGMGGASVETLAAFAGTASDKLIACANGNIYDVTTSTPTSLASGLANNYWSTTLINNILLFFNGVDTPRQYNGTAVSNAVYTGVGLTATKLCHVNRYRSRLYMVEEGSLKMWYSDVSSVTGALTDFDLSRIFTKGGKLLWTATWTRDGGNGMDDLFVAATNKGEVVVYSGSYPADASWSLVGLFEIPELIGRRSYHKLGSELVVLTGAGMFPLSRLLQSGVSSAVSGVFSDKVNPAFPALAKAYGANTGWDIKTHPTSGILYVNVPISSNASIQFACSTATGVWSRFKNINARSWAVYDRELYFGDAEGKVFKAETGNTDNSAPLQFSVGQAYSPYTIKERKNFKMLRPIITLQGEATVNLTVRTDFSVSIPENEVVVSTGSHSSWGNSPWNTSPWTIEKTVLELVNCGTAGRYGSICLQGQTSSTGLDWHGTDILIEPSENVF